MLLTQVTERTRRPYKEPPPPPPPVRRGRKQTMRLGQLWELALSPICLGMKSCPDHNSGTAGMYLGRKWLKYINLKFNLIKGIPNDISRITKSACREKIYFLQLKDLLWSARGRSRKERIWGTRCQHQAARWRPWNQKQKEGLSLGLVAANINIRVYKPILLMAAFSKNTEP